MDVDRPRDIMAIILIVMSVVIDAYAESENAFLVL